MTTENTTMTKKATITASIEAALSAEKLTWTVNKKGQYLTKAKDAEGKTYTMKLTVFQKENLFRVQCNEVLVSRVNATEKDYEYHPGWACKYTLKMSVADIMKALKVAKVKPEEVKTEEVKEEAKPEEVATPAPVEEKPKTEEKPKSRGRGGKNQKNKSNKS